MELKEEWRQVGATEYDVSNLGRVRSHKTREKDGSPKILSAYKLNGRHLGVPIDGKDVYVHRLVATEFHGPAPYEGAQVYHWDDDPSNNNVDNLYWGSRIQNAIDRKFNRNPDRVTRSTPERQASFDALIRKLVKLSGQSEEEIVDLLARRLFVLIEPRTA